MTQKDLEPTVVLSQPESKSNKKKEPKASLNELVNYMAYVLAPYPIPRERVPGMKDEGEILSEICLRNLPHGKDFRVYVGKKKHKSWVIAEKNGELQRVSDRYVEEVLHQSFSSLGINEYLGKDFDQVAHSALNLAERFDSLMSGEDKFTLTDDDIAIVRFKSQPGYCWKKLDFDPDVNSDPTIWETELLPRISKNTYGLLAWIGSLFDETSNREKYVWLHGEGGSGKSRITDFLLKLFGISGTVKKHQTIDDKWFTNSLLGMRLCVIHEAPSKIVSTGTWKSLTGDDEHDVEEKFKSPKKERIFVKFVITSNKFPTLPPGEEFRRRLILVSVDRVSEELKTIRSTEETTELLLKGAPYIIARALEEYNKDKYLNNLDMEKVDELQGNDFRLQMMEYFELDKNSYVTNDKITAMFRDKDKHEIQKFLNHIHTTHGVKSVLKKISGSVCRCQLGIKCRVITN